MSREEKVKQLKDKIIQDIDKRLKGLREELQTRPIEFENASFGDKLHNEDGRLNDFGVYNILINDYFYMMRIREYVMLPDTFMEVYPDSGRFIIPDKNIDIMLEDDYNFVFRIVGGFYDKNSFLDDEIESYITELNVMDITSTFNPKFIRDTVNAIDECLYDKKQREKNE